MSYPQVRQLETFDGSASVVRRVVHAAIGAQVVRRSARRLTRRRRAAGYGHCTG